MCLSRNMSKSEMLAKVECAREVMNRYRGQARFLRLTSDDGRQNGARRVCVQCAWNERSILRYWLKESAMTAQQTHDREVTRAMDRIAAEITFWRNELHCSPEELSARIRRWENTGDMAFTRSVRGIAVSMMLDIHA